MATAERDRTTWSGSHSGTIPHAGRRRLDAEAHCVDATFYAAITVLACVVVIVLAYASREVAPVGSWAVFILGSGWWMVWHALLLATFVGFAAGTTVAVVMTADEIGVSLAIIGASVALLFLMSVADGILWSTTRFDAWWARFLLGPMLVVAASIAILALVLVYNQVLAYFLAGGWLEALAGAALLGGIIWLNLLALHAFRG